MSVRLLGRCWRRRPPCSGAMAPQGSRGARRRLAQRCAKSCRPPRVSNVYIPSSSAARQGSGHSESSQSLGKNAGSHLDHHTTFGRRSCQGCRGRRSSTAAGSGQARRRRGGQTGRRGHAQPPPAAGRRPEDRAAVQGAHLRLKLQQYGPTSQHVRCKASQSSARTREDALGTPCRVGASRTATSCCAACWLGCSPRSAAC